MTKRTYYEKEKRVSKISRDDQLELMFDLINAVSLVRTPTDTAFLLKDLLTAKEIKNLAKRLRIAKLILNGETEKQITQTLHCSFETVSKISLWLNQGGEGLRSVIAKLPVKYKIPKNLPKVPLEFQLPKLIMTFAEYSIANKQKDLLENFAKGVSLKESVDNTFH